MPRLQPDPLILPLPLTIPKPIAQGGKPSTLTRIWQTICRIAFKIFSMLGCSRSLERLFNSQELQLMRDERLALLAQPHNSLPHKKLTLLKPSTMDSEIPSNEEEPSLSSKNYSYIKYDDTLEKGREAMRDISLLTLDIIHENSFEPMVESLQQMAPSIPPLVKSTAKLLIEMGDKAAKPLFTKLAQHKTEVIEPAIKAILKTLIKIDSTTLRGDLFKYLQGQMEGVSLPPGQKSLHYIKPIMKRLFPKLKPSPLETNGVSPELTLDAKLMEELFAKAQAFCRTSNAADVDKLYHRLFHQIDQDLKDIKIPNGQDLTKDYIKPVLDWLLRSDLSTPIADLFIPSENFDENLIDRVFEITTTILVEKKIDHYVNFLDETLQQRLGDILHNMILVNTVNIANYFSGRFSEMMTHFPYPETYDKLTSSIFAKQLEGFVTAKEAAKDHKKLLEKSRQAIKLEAYSPAEIKAKSRAEMHLAIVEQHGGEERFLQHMFLEAFSKQKCCNPNVLQIIEQQISTTLQNRDPKNAIHAIEQSFFASIADEIMTLMLPTRKKRGPNGVVEETEAVVELWNQLYLPPEFLELMKHVVEITSEFITPDTTSLFASIKEPLLMVTQKLAITLAQDMFKKKLVALLQKCFEMIANPEDLNELSAESILPTINELLLSYFMNQEIGRNAVKITPLFRDLVHSISVNRDAAYKKVQEGFLKIVKAKFHEFQGKNFHVTETVENGTHTLKFEDLSDDEILRMLSPLIEKIEKKLEEKLHEPGHVRTTLDQREVLAIIKKFFEGAPPAKFKEDAYGEIVMNLVFKIGGWKNEGLVGYFIRDALSQSITNSTQELRSSYHFLLTSAFQVMKRVFTDRTRMERYLGIVPSYHPEYTKEKLQFQTETLSRLTYDLITGVAGDKGVLTKMLTTKFIYNDSKAIHELIGKIYHEILGNKILNQNLLMQAVEEVFQSFRVSAQTIRTKEGLLNQKAVSLT